MKWKIFTWNIIYIDTPSVERGFNFPVESYQTLEEGLAIYQFSLVNRVITKYLLTGQWKIKRCHGSNKKNSPNLPKKNN